MKLDLAAREVTFLVAIFGKNEKSDLSTDELKLVAKLVRELDASRHHWVAIGSNGMPSASRLSRTRSP